MIARPLKEAELHAFLDGELTNAAHAEVEALLKDAPAEAEAVHEFAALNQAIRQRYAPLLDAAIPDALCSLVARVPEAATNSAALRKPAAVAAAIALALAAGFAGYILRDRTGSAPASAPAFVITAIDAHAVYAPEVRHPVEVGAGEETHLVQWLTKRIGADVRAPALAPLGWKLVGGRLLPGHGKPAAQFMYEDGTGRRLTLYIRKEPGLDDTSFRFAEQGEFSAFYWIDRPLAYALAGRLKRDELTAIAKAVYKQLDLGAPAPAALPDKGSSDPKK
jgi:anti-sigma factor RsiW